MTSQADSLPESAAYAFVESMVPRADCYGPGDPTAPLWHGWALREAYLAGVAAERNRAKPGGTLFVMRDERRFMAPSDAAAIRGQEGK
jgi:hypothetical protein